jgi:hypothetical protein
MRLIEKLGGNASHTYPPFRCLGYDEDKNKPGLLLEPTPNQVLVHSNSLYLEKA